MGKLVMAYTKINEETLDIEIYDIQRIHHVPYEVQKLIQVYTKGKRRLKSGLPSVQYLGPDRVHVIGAFNYGEVSFLEIEGKWSNIVKCDSLICIVPYRDDLTYEELLEHQDEYLESQKTESEESELGEEPV